MTRPRTAVRRIISQPGPRSHSVASVTIGTYFNDFAVVDTQYIPPTLAQLAAARRCLEAHDALDVAEMLGLPCATQKSDAVLTGATAQ